MKIKDTESLKMKGVWTVTQAFIENFEQKKLHDKITDLRSKGFNYMHLVRELNKKCKTEINTIENIIPLVGRTMIINNLTNVSPDNDMVVNYIALGTDNTAVANGDTTLGTEIYRNQVASKTNSNNIGYISGFFNATEVADTLYEAGVFSDGTASADSGILVSHVLLNSPTGIVKTSVTSLTLDWSITLS